MAIRGTTTQVYLNGAEIKNVKSLEPWVIEPSDELRLANGVKSRKKPASFGFDLKYAVSSEALIDWVNLTDATVLAVYDDGHEDTFTGCNLKSLKPVGGGEGIDPINEVSCWATGLSQK